MKSKKRNWLKLSLQGGTLLAIVAFILYGIFFGEQRADPEAYCPFGGLQAIGSYLHNNSLACSMSMAQIMMGVVLAVGVILFSKLFCGYLCPLGTIGEYLGKGGRKLKMNFDLKPGGIADRGLRIVKYGLLFVVFYMSVSSSELFCKNFDPYYAMATGFKGEITAWMTSISIVLLFLGSFFIKMFWCKYICPLGALSNIFKFTITFVGLLLLFWLLGWAGLPSAWVWALGAACLIGYLYEMIYLRSKVFPLLRIVRDAESCNGCGSCTKKCPYHIDLKELKTVRHIDCTLCGDCVSSCPKGSLQVGGKKSLRWLPGILTIVLFVLALILGNQWELPTIDERWGNTEQVGEMKTFEMEGLTSIKCYGSSKAFSAKMQKVPGVYGVKTFVKRHAVVISYDPAQTNEDKIREVIFIPTIMKFSNPEPQVDSVEVLTLGVDKLFDRMDMVYFGNILKQIPGIYGFDAEYSCPVTVKLYADPSAELSEKLLKDSIEVEQTHMLAAGGKVRWFPVDYKLVSYERNGDRISSREFVELMFKPTAAMSGKFLDNMKKLDGRNYETAVYEVEYPAIEKKLIKKGFPYFKSFLSTQEGILRIDVQLKDTTPVLRITYVTGMWDDAKIWTELFNAPKWTIKYTDGSTKEEEPKLKFKNEGRTVPESPGAPAE